MAFKDKLSLAISVLALVLSGTSLYFSQFRTSYAIEAVVLNADVLGGHLAYEVAILNQGTNRFIIRDARLRQEKRAKTLAVVSPFKAVVRTPALPTVVAANDVLVLTFKGPLALPQLHDEGDAPDKGGHEEFDGEPTRKITLSASVEALDFLGRHYQAHVGVKWFHATRTTVASSGDSVPQRAFFERISSR